MRCFVRGDCTQVFSFCFAAPAVRSFARGPSTVSVALFPFSIADTSALPYCPNVPHGPGSSPADKDCGSGTCWRTPGQHGVGECAQSTSSWRRHRSPWSFFLGGAVFDFPSVPLSLSFPSVSPSFFFFVDIAVCFRTYGRGVFPLSSFSVGTAVVIVRRYRAISFPPYRRLRFPSMCPSSISVYCGRRFPSVPPPSVSVVIVVCFRRYRRCRFPSVSPSAVSVDTAVVIFCQCCCRRFPSVSPWLVFRRYRHRCFLSVSPW